MIQEVFGESLREDGEWTSGDRSHLNSGKSMWVKRRKIKYVLEMIETSQWEDKTLPVLRV